MYLNANIIGLLEAAFEPSLVIGEEVVMPGMGRAEMIFVSISLFFPQEEFMLERKGLRGKVKTKRRDLKDRQEQENGMKMFLLMSV